MSCVLLDVLGLPGDHHDVANAIAQAAHGSTTNLDRLVAQIHAGDDLRRLALAAEAVTAAVQREVLRRGRIAEQNRLLAVHQGGQRG